MPLIDARETSVDMDTLIISCSVFLRDAEKPNIIPYSYRQTTTGWQWDRSQPKTRMTDNYMEKCGVQSPRFLTDSRERVGKRVVSIK